MVGTLRTKGITASAGDLYEVLIIPTCLIVYKDKAATIDEL